MKLSELFNKPFKLKGGSTLNLKGFSKRVVDRDIDGGDSDSYEDTGYYIFGDYSLITITQNFWSTLESKLVETCEQAGVDFTNHLSLSLDILGLRVTEIGILDNYTIFSEDDTNFVITGNAEFDEHGTVEFNYDAPWVKEFLLSNSKRIYTKK